MFYQTDSKLIYNAKSDCYIFDILKIHEIIGKHEFDYRQLKAMRKLMVRAEFIGKDGYINAKGISGITSVASGLTGHNVYIKRVGIDDIYNFVIAQFSRFLSNNDLVTHFNLMYLNKPKIVQWDPWSEDGARTTKIGNITGYRYIWAEAV